MYNVPRRYMSALRCCYAAQGLELVGFERHLRLRGKGGNHCHINLIGVPKASHIQHCEAVCVV